jgi:RNA methyltransferase, TrmH family
MTLPNKAELALYYKLGRRAVRQAEGLLLIEGPNAVHAALKAQLAPVCLLVKDASLLTPDLPAMTTVAPDAVLSRLATTDSPPPLLGVFRQPPVLNLLPQPGQRWLAMAGLQDPGNAGTLIRCVRAFNGHGVLVTPDTVDVYSPKVIRATAGEVFFCPVTEVPDLQLPITLPLFATRAQQAAPYNQADWTTGGLLILGQEGNGLQPDAVPSHTRWLCVPQNPAVDSLNVAISGAIIMAQWLNTVELA